MEASDYKTIRQLFDDYLRIYSSRDDRLTSYFSEGLSGFTGGGDFLVKDRKDQPHSCSRLPAKCSTDYPDPLTFPPLVQLRTSCPVRDTILTLHCCNILELRNTHSWRGFRDISMYQAHTRS